MHVNVRNKLLGRTHPYEKAKKEQFSDKDEVKMQA